MACAHEPKLIRDESGKPAFYRCLCGMWSWSLEGMAEIVRQIKGGR